MRKTVVALLAVSGLALATPAVAQVYFGAGPGGVGVGVGPGPGYYDHGYYGGPYYHEDRTVGYDRYVGAERCRTTIIRRSDGSVRKIRRCRD